MKKNNNTAAEIRTRGRKNRNMTIYYCFLWTEYLLSFLRKIIPIKAR